MGKADRDNRVNQLNRNNAAYWQSRPDDERPDDSEELDADDLEDDENDVDDDEDVD